MSHRTQDGNKTNKRNDGIFEIFQLKPNANPPLKVGILVNSKLVSMEIDTGASISLINCETFLKLYDNKARINLTSSRIRTYTGKIAKPKGSIKVQVEYNGQKTRGRVIVINGNCSNLLGRDIRRKIKLNWNELFNTNQVNEYIVDG